MTQIIFLRERHDAAYPPDFFHGEQVVKVLKSHPKVLRYDVEEQLEPHAVWLEEIGLSKEGIAKVIAKVPQVRSFLSQSDGGCRIDRIYELFFCFREGIW